MRFVLALAVLAPCWLGFGAAAGALEIRTHTASELGFMASSHLILGREEAILVDAQFTLSEARDVVLMIESSGRTLRTIFITHAQPDHYLGLEVITGRFPDARVLSRPWTARAIAEAGEDAIGRWQPIYLDDLAARVVTPEPFEGGALILDEVEILVHDPSKTPRQPTVLYIAEERTLIAGDLAFGGLHAWLAVPPAEQLRSLKALRGLGPIDFVYPGHGAAAGSKLLGEAEKYLETLDQALAGSATAREAINAMMLTYPEYGMPILLEQSVRALRGSTR